MVDHHGFYKLAVVSNVKLWVNNDLLLAINVGPKWLLVREPVVSFPVSLIASLL